VRPELRGVMASWQPNCRVYSQRRKKRIAALS
jgi:hypothetical protein